MSKVWYCMVPHEASSDSEASVTYFCFLCVLTSSFLPSLPSRFKRCAYNLNWLGTCWTWAIGKRTLFYELMLAEVHAGMKFKSSFLNSWRNLNCCLNKDYTSRAAAAKCPPAYLEGCSGVVIFLCLVFRGHTSFSGIVPLLQGLHLTFRGMPPSCGSSCPLPLRNLPVT